jgi:hypothetical protein
LNDRNPWNEPPDAILEGCHRAQIGKRLFHQCNHDQIGQQQRVSAQIAQKKLLVRGAVGPNDADRRVGVDGRDARPRPLEDEQLLGPLIGQFDTGGERGAGRFPGEAPAAAACPDGDDTGGERVLQVVAGRVAAGPGQRQQRLR